MLDLWLFTCVLKPYCGTILVLEKAIQHNLLYAVIVLLLLWQLLFNVQRRSRADSSDNIYTETAFGLESNDLLPQFGSKRSIRSSSVDTTLTVDTSHSLAKDSVNSEAPLLGPDHYYHELENKSSPRPLPRLPPSIMVESETRGSLSDSLVCYQTHTTISYKQIASFYCTCLRI